MARLCARAALLALACGSVRGEDSSGGPPGGRSMGDAMGGEATRASLVAVCRTPLATRLPIDSVICVCAPPDPAVLEQAMKMMQNPMVMQQMKVMMQDPAVKARMKRMLQRLGENSAMPGAEKFANDDEMLDSIFERSAQTPAAAPACAISFRRAHAPRRLDSRWRGRLVLAGWLW